MEEELILQQPSDRRLGNVNSLPPGPPGAEFDTVDFETKNVPKQVEKESSTSRSRRRSPSPVARRRRTPSSSRGRRRSPSPVARRRRSPSPRRNRFRDYSPDRRHRRGGRGDRFRGRGIGRGRSVSRSRSRSISPKRSGAGSNSTTRWSPKKKTISPVKSIMTQIPQPSITQPPPSQTQNQPQFNVMPPQVYGDNYGAPAYHQFTVPPPQPGFVPPPDAYTMQPPPQTPSFNTAYPPPPNWGVNDTYGQQPWMQQPVPDASQMQQMPPATAPTSQVRPPTITAQCLNVLADAAPGTLESNPVHNAAVAQEAEIQRDELKKQRGGYMKKTALLKKELKMLKEQRKDLNTFDAPPSPTTKGFIDENEKLQSQITKKLATIENVIDMLTNIIGDDNMDKEKTNNSDFGAVKDESKQRNDLNAGNALRKPSHTSSTSESSSGSSSSSSTSDSSSSSENENDDDDDDDSSPERLKNKVMESMKLKQKEMKKGILAHRPEKAENDKKRYNYVFYDPEMHWCQTCDVFPKTAKDYLNHLHTNEHMDRESIETPWHFEMVSDQYPTYDNASTKRTPIRGLTFFVPATAWFCKLCNEWMGDLHCASTHLKSQTHSNKYNLFLEKNPHFEVNWLADRDRQRVLSEKKSVQLPPQNTSISTTAAEQGNKTKGNKKEDSKSIKKRKRNSDKKDKKKKKKRSKKRKRATSTGSSSSSDSSSSNEESKRKSPIKIKDLDNPNPASSIRVAMRKQDTTKDNEAVLLPPPPPIIAGGASSAISTKAGPIGKWIVSQEGILKQSSENSGSTDSKREDAILQQWNTVQPVISESEKKLLEQLKGKLKNKPKEESGRNVLAIAEKDGRDRQRNAGRRDGDTEHRRRSRSPAYNRRGGRSHTRSSSRSRSRGHVGRRSRSRSPRRRGRRFSPIGRGGGRRRRSRTRSPRRRSRSRDRRRRSSRSRSRSRSGSKNRVEKAVVKHSEFRPRVPEKEKEKEKKSNESKEKREKSKKIKAAAAGSTGKKLPFIGKMPVFKKQVSGLAENGNSRAEDGVTYMIDNNGAPTATFTQQRHAAPTAAQIQMAMMEDVYGNAPPFHPDAGMVVDYDDLMPDPVQFVNLMNQAPPPPPPATQTSDSSAKEDDADMLPPGIDETESEEFVPKPISDAPMPRKGPLPKDLEEALNIIFPGERKEGEESDSEIDKKKRSAGETQIIVDDPIMQPEDLVKEGIHLITIEETSIAGMDEASQISMNEPLVFNKPNPAKETESTVPICLIEDTSSQNAADIDLTAVKSVTEVVPTEGSTKEFDIEQVVPETSEAETPTIVPAPADIPMPDTILEEDDATAVIYNLDDIPHPPASPTESEKNRRQEELDDLAMLGIDADDMAAQCM